MPNTKIEGSLKQLYLKRTKPKEVSKEELQNYGISQLGTRLFMDTSYAIALTSVSDQHNRLAKLLSEKIEENKIKLITTQAILLEIGNALSKLRFRQAAIALLDSIEKDDNVEIIPISEPLYKKGFNLFKKSRDKEWGIIDCISFIAMKEHKLNEALTTDRHFIQAGFKILLR